MPGLRNAAFVDEFGENGLKLSICERDFSAAMTTIGQRLAAMAFAPCYDFELADADPATPGVQPECTMSWSTGVRQPSGAPTYRDGPVLPACAPGAVQGGVPEDCWRFSSDLDQCPTHGQRLEVLRTSEEIVASKWPPPGTKIHVRCRTCADSAAAGCAY